MDNTFNLKLTKPEIDALARVLPKAVRGSKPIEGSPEANSLLDKVIDTWKDSNKN